MSDEPAHVPAWLRVAHSASTDVGCGRLTAAGSNLLGALFNARGASESGTFVGSYMAAAGIAGPRLPARAKSWIRWGRNVPPHQFVPGTVLVFRDSSGWNVGFYADQDAVNYQVLNRRQGALHVEHVPKSSRPVGRWPENLPLVGRASRYAIDTLEQSLAIQARKDGRLPLPAATGFGPAFQRFEDVPDAGDA